MERASEEEPLFLFFFSLMLGVPSPSNGFFFHHLYMRRNLFVFIEGIILIISIAIMFPSLEDLCLFDALHDSQMFSSLKTRLSSIPPSIARG